MVLDQVENFIRVSVAGGHASGDNTISLQSGEASLLPDVTQGKYNLIWWDSENFSLPSEDPSVEIVRVNSINTTNDTISVTRGQENTSATSKNASTGEYSLILGPTAKTIEDIDSTKLDASAYSPEADTHARYSDSEARGAINGSVIEPEQAIHSRSIDSSLTLSSDQGLVLAGPVSGSGSISGEGSFVVTNNPLSESEVVNLIQSQSIDADTLDGIDSTGFIQTGDTIDADTLDGIDSTGFIQTGDTIDADTLDGIDSTGFIQTGDTIDADTLDGIDSTGFIQTGDTIDADTLDGIDSTGFIQTGDTIDADTLDGIDSTGFIQTGDTIDADTLDGLDASQLGIDVSNNASTIVSNATDINFGSGLVASDDTDGTSTVSLDSLSHNNLTNIGSSDHHTRYSDSEAITAINNESSLSVDITGDANTLEGLSSTDFVQSTSGIIPHGSFSSLSDVPSTTTGDVFHVDSEGLFVETDNTTPSDTTTPLQDHIQDSNPHPQQNLKTQVVSLTTSSNQDVNQTTTVSWDEHIIEPSDNAFSHTTGNTSVTINESGTYKIYANLYTDSNNDRTNPSFRFRVNGSEVAGRSGSAYARNAEGHDRTSTSLEIIRELSSGDTVDVRTFAEASGGTCRLQDRHSIFTIEKLIR